MVTPLALLPPAVAAVLLAVDALVAGDVVIAVVSSWALYLGLSLAVLLAVLAAAYARRDNAVLSSAWLFFFCGMLFLSLAELLEMLQVSGPPWVSDLFEVAGFVPLLIFAAYVAAPLRILVVGRRRAALYAVLGLGLILLVVALTLPPWVGGGAARHGGRWFLVLKPELDALLLLPLALLLLVLGAARRSHPYLFVGLGLLLMLPADLLGYYHLLSGVGLHERLAAVLSVASQIYMLIGALACAFRRLPGARGRRRGAAAGRTMRRRRLAAADGSHARGAGARGPGDRRPRHGLWRAAALLADLPLGPLRHGRAGPCHVGRRLPGSRGRGPPCYAESLPLRRCRGRTPGDRGPRHGEHGQRHVRRRNKHALERGARHAGPPRLRGHGAGALRQRASASRARAGDPAVRSLAGRRRSAAARLAARSQRFRRAAGLRLRAAQADRSAGRRAARGLPRSPRLVRARPRPLPPAAHGLTGEALRAFRQGDPPARRSLVHRNLGPPGERDALRSRVGAHQADRREGRVEGPRDRQLHQEAARQGLDRDRSAVRVSHAVPGGCARP